jgi:hypothetical protein
MKKIIQRGNQGGSRFAGLAGAILGLTSAVGSTTASAGTFQCDNDPVGYPCTTSRPSDWIYRSNQPGDANGDDRLSHASNPSAYVWAFTGVGTVQVLGLDVFLNNISFTEPNAEYFTPAGRIGAINQNTASGGWHHIGSQVAQTSARITLKRHAANTTGIGADLIQIKTSSISPAIATGSGSTSTSTSTSLAEPVNSELFAPERIDDPALCGARFITDRALSAIQQRMLDAIDHFRDVQGSAVVRFSNSGQDEVVAFELSEQSPGSRVTITSRSGDVLEQAFDGKQLVRIDRARSAVDVAALAPVVVPSGPRQYFTTSCEPVFVHRQDPAGAHGAADVVLPENYAFWLSSSDAHIAGSVSLLGRAATVIEGSHDEYLRTKLGASTFKMWVDDQTGVLLQLVGSDADGTAVYSVVVKNIQFDQGVDRRRFQLEQPRG